MMIVILNFDFIDDCRELVFPSFFFFAHKRLVKHNITTIQVHDLEECKWRCYQDPNCLSVNIHTHKNDDGLYRCELNNATHLRHGLEFEDKVDYFYHGADVRLKIELILLFATPNLS